MHCKDYGHMTNARFLIIANAASKPLASSMGQSTSQLVDFAGFLKTSVIYLCHFIVVL